MMSAPASRYAGDARQSDPAGCGTRYRCSSRGERRRSRRPQSRLQDAAHRAVDDDDTRGEGIMKSLLTELSIFHGFIAV